MTVRTLDRLLYHVPGFKAQDPLAIAVRCIAVGAWSAAADLAIELKAAGGSPSVVLDAECDFPTNETIELELTALSGPAGVIWAGVRA